MHLFNNVAFLKRSPLILWTIFLAVAPCVQSAVVINEIMYHPSSENTDEEFIELYNSGGADVDISGWKFTSGVDFTLPAGSVIPAGGYLVVAANAAAFQAKYPGVTNFVGGWTGILSNSGNKITLDDAAGVAMNEVSYTDDGDWAVRIRDVDDSGHRGWTWHSDADGFGKSLELINPLFLNQHGENWSASTTAQGTPGRVNSVAANNIAPLILDVAHFPPVPTSTETVNVTALAVDDAAGAITMRVHYRLDGGATFAIATMADDGAHGDGGAGDAVFGATLPAQADGAIVEFYIEAVDATNRTRFWPAPQKNDAVTVQTQNCLYQVDNATYSGAQPYYKMVMRAVDRTELADINAGNGAFTNARFNTTWITRDGTSSELRYLTGVRNRGHGSATRQPQSFNITFRNDDKWKGITALNLNTQSTHSQYFGSTLFRAAGLPAPESRPVQVRVNNVNPAAGNGTSNGFYVANEVQDSDFAAHHFPLDSSGDIYRVKRTDGAPPPNTLSEGALDYAPPAAGQAPPDPYRSVYFKHTNSSEDNWNDLINLTIAMSKGHSDASFNTTYDAGYEAAVRAAVDLDEWMRFFAAETLVDNSETNISNGFGDDYYLYFGVIDPRAKLIPFDLDTISGQGDNVPGPTDHGLFRMVNKDDNSGNGPTRLNSFIKFQAFAPLYYGALHQLIDGPFAPATFDTLVDNTLNGVVPQARISSIKAFQDARTAYIASLIPLNISVTNATTTGGTPLPVTNGFPRSTASACALSGRANAIDTRSVKVNGATANWTAWTATWSAPNVPLTPGINKIVIQSFDSNNKEFERSTYDVWYDDASVATVSGSIAANTTWTAAGGPYQVSANLTVANGATLTIQPGTTVYVSSGLTITVNGKIVANGTATQHIRFTKLPSGSNGGSIDFINTGTNESQLAYVDFDSLAGTTIGGHNAQVHVNNSTVFFDHVTYPPTPVVEYISFDASSFIVQNSTFPSYPPPTGPESLHGINGIMTNGYGIFRDNYFGHTWGFNDTIDFTGGNRPGPILQIINNVFDGASDDCLDLDSTDAWIEGNVFMHVHRDPTRTDDARDTGSAISGGVDFVGQNPDWTIINNIFYDVDHVFLNKGNSTTTGNGGGRVAFLYNTVAHVAKEGSGSTEAEIGAFDWTDDGIRLPDPSIGSGMYAAYNIIYDCPVLQVNYNPANLTIIMDNNILSVPWAGPGSGNQVVDPRLNIAILNGTPVANVTADQLRQAYQLLPGSPAIGTAFGQRNIGGLNPHGIAISGEPGGTTNSTGATLTVGPGGTFDWGTTTPQPWGWTAFKWKLDGGAWSAEIPVNNPSPFNTPATIAISGLTDGPHTVYVSGKNDAGYYQDDPFVYPLNSGTPATPTASRTWMVDSAYVPPGPAPLVQINELLAKNSETQGFSGVFPDIIELHNAGTAAADISGWGLTDNVLLPYKYSIPAGTTLAAGAYLVIYADANALVPQPQTGFGLKQGGDTLTLTQSPGAGGAVADSIPFGAQIADYSIGRRPSDGQWDLCVPTFGAANVVAAQGSIANVKINEWLADAIALAPNDFIELYNGDTKPVALGNAYLTDNPVEWPTRHQIRQLTFVGAGGYVAFKADNDPEQGADHLDFKLSPAQGEIGFFSPSQMLIDNIVYGSQSSDVSEGRTPNGSATIAFFNQPTPGAPNPGEVGGGGTTTTTTLIAPTQVWKYYANATAAPANDAQGRSFISPTYNDAAWVSGGGVLYIENATIPPNSDGFAKTTLLPPATPAAPNTTPYQTYYFRTHFNFGGAAGGVTLAANVMSDDGAIFYLNGQELVPTGGRLRMPAGAATYATLTTNTAPDDTIETVSFPATLLVAGDNVLAVEVHQGVLQSGGNPSSDITWGMKLTSTVTTVAGASAVVLNEVFPINISFQNPDGSFAGWIELSNTSSSAVDISDMSLTNDVTIPRQFVFPQGTSIPANGFLVFYCNSLAAPSASNTGFGLGSNGGGVFMFGKIANGGGLHDSVVYGQQVPDFSIGRTPNGTGPFALNVPTYGALNQAAGLGPITAVKINEWLALPNVPPAFFELYNTSAQPVLLSGNYLTDNLNNKTKFLLPPLSFIGGAGSSHWLSFIADNDTSATPGHVNFSIDPAGESLGLFAANGVRLESVTFGPQAVGVSQGRFPDGTATVLTLTPTPSAPNQQSATDTDGDGMPDDWEIAHGFNPNDATDALGDADGDGQSNYVEYLQGTDPRDASSRFTLTISSSIPGQIHLLFTAQANKGYTVQFKTSPADPVWQRLSDVAAQSLLHQVDILDNVGTTAQRFYRVVTPQQP